MVALRLTEDEFEEFMAEAKKAGLSAVAFARHCWHIRRTNHGENIQSAKVQEKRRDGET